jgi:UDP-glucuronate 4-epimerase
LGYTYSKLYNIDFIALRFFTVYGPRQRPDLAIHKFFKLIQGGEELHVFGTGDTTRDYTYVEDIVKGMVSCLDRKLSGFQIINLGNNKTVKLIDLVREIENVIGKHAKVIFESEKPGDVRLTYADISKARALLGYSPKVELSTGLVLFHEWFKEYYNLKD